MQKCGMIEKDLETGKHKIKLYRDENGQVKGDALCTYIKVSLKIIVFLTKFIAKSGPGSPLLMVVRKCSADFCIKSIFVIRIIFFLYSY
jgi:hypothetical protein